MGTYIMQPDRRALYERDRWKCYLCGRHVFVSRPAPGHPLPADAATLDHVVPICRGGTNAESNLRTACAECNGLKGALTLEEFRQGMPKLEALTAPVAPADGTLKVTLGELVTARQRAA